MKRMVVALACLLVACGCSQWRSQANVRASFPGAEIQPVPDQKYCWLVRQSNTVMWVRDFGGTPGKVHKGFVIVLFGDEKKGGE